MLSQTRPIYREGRSRRYSGSRRSSWRREWDFGGEYDGNDSVFASLKGKTINGAEVVGASVQAFFAVSQDLVGVGFVAEVEHNLTIESITVSGTSPTKQS